MSCAICQYFPKTTKCIYCGDDKDKNVSSGFPVRYPEEKHVTLLSELAEIKKDIQAIKNMLQEQAQKKSPLTCVCGNQAKENCLGCDKPVCRPCIDGYNTTGVICKGCARCPTGY